MERISITQATAQFPDLLDRVIQQGASFEVEQDSRIIARLLPVGAPARIQVKDLNRLFAELPDLGDDAAAFANDVAAIRNELPPEPEPWD